MVGKDGKWAPDHDAPKTKDEKKEITTALMAERAKAVAILEEYWEQLTIEDNIENNREQERRMLINGGVV